MEAGLWPQENDTEFGFRKVIFAKEQKGHDLFTYKAIHFASGIYFLVSFCYSTK